MRYKYQVEFEVDIEAENEQEALNELNEIILEQFDSSEELVIIKKERIKPWLNKISDLLKSKH